MTGGRLRSKPLPRRSTSILVIDDQPFELQWLEEFLIVQGFAFESATDLKDGIDKIEASERDKYKLLVVDMEIPTGGYVGRFPKEPQRATLYQTYPGLMAVQVARNYDYNSSNVLVYSVHQSDAINAEVSLLRCRYMLKGRPRGLKEILLSMLGRSGPPKPPRGK